MSPSTPPSRATVAPADIPANANTNRCIRDRRRGTKNTSVARGSTNRQKATSTGSAIQSGSVGSGVVGSTCWLPSELADAADRTGPSNGLQLDHRRRRGDGEHRQRHEIGDDPGRTRGAHRAPVLPNRAFCTSG